MINKLLGRKFNSGISTIIEEVTNIIGTTSIQKAQIFHRHLIKKMRVAVNHVFPNFPLRTNQVLTSFVTDPQEILSLLRDLPSGKATGPDKISHEMIKLCSDELAVPLSRLFNRLLENNLFPIDWKNGDVSMIYKKLSKSKCCNYRPITLLNSLSKVYERVIYSRMSSFLLRNNLIYNLQSGFLKGHSCTMQLVSIVHYLKSEIHKGNNVRTVFLDLAAAFDTVPHSLLLHKAKSYGFSEDILSLLKSYLTNRKIRISVNGSLSDYSLPGQINAGVPQGSILGSLLFLFIY